MTKVSNFVLIFTVGEASPPTYARVVQNLSVALMPDARGLFFVFVFFSCGGDPLQDPK